MDTIIVNYKGNLMLLSSTVAKCLNITNGYRIRNEEEFWEIITLNALYVIKYLESKLESDTKT